MQLLPGVELQRGHWGSALCAVGSSSRAGDGDEGCWLCGCVTMCCVFLSQTVGPGATQSKALSLVPAAVPGVEEAAVGTIIHPSVWGQRPAGNTLDWCGAAQVFLGKAKRCS